jgi:hypothetical protein
MLRHAGLLELEVWSFSGAWMLELGAFIPLPFPRPRIVAKDVAEEGLLVAQFSSDSFNFLAGDAEQYAVAYRARAANKRGAFLDRAGGNLLQQGFTGSLQWRADQEQSSEAIKTSHLCR